MHETMKHSGGIGLAANQVGDLRRVIVMEIPYQEDPEDPQEVKEPWHDKPFTFINPQIISSSSGKIKYYEGCLSFPEVYEYIQRSEKVTVKAFDENGKEFTVEANGLFAICLQHEIDHIDGVVFLNRMSRLKARFVRQKLMRQGTSHLPPEKRKEHA
jgi:peptide deformylase